VKKQSGSETLTVPTLNHNRRWVLVLTLSIFVLVNLGIASSVFPNSFGRVGIDFVVFVVSGFFLNFG